MFFILILNILKVLKILSLISLPVNSCNATMASRRSKDKHPATNTSKQLVKQEPTVLASSYDSYAMVPVNQPVKTTFSKNPNASQYITKQYCQNLFSIEPNRAMIKDPLKLATGYFPQNFHWILGHICKDLRYYYAILFHEKSILSNINLIKLIHPKLFTIVFSYSTLLLKKNGDSVLLLQNLYLARLFLILTMTTSMPGSSSCYTKMKI